MVWQGILYIVREDVVTLSARLSWLIQAQYMIYNSAILLTNITRNCVSIYHYGCRCKGLCSLKRHLAAHQSGCDQGLYCTTPRLASIISGSNPYNEEVVSDIHPVTLVDCTRGLNQVSTREVNEFACSFGKMRKGKR